MITAGSAVIKDNTIGSNLATKGTAADEAALGISISGGTAVLGNSETNGDGNTIDGFNTGIETSVETDILGSIITGSTTGKIILMVM